MNDRELVRMANQIADYFKPYPDEEGLAGVAGHIRSFWDPRMRAALSRHVAAGGPGLQPLALAAMRRLLAPPASVASSRSYTLGLPLARALTYPFSPAICLSVPALPRIHET